MTAESTGVTVHAFIRPGTPSSAGPAVVTQIVDLYEFGLIGPGSQVWCNLDVPNALWVLSDRSTFLRIVDVPTAGWVRLTHDSAVWGRVAIDTTKSPSHGFNAADMPMPVQPHDTVTVAFRNTDPAPMRAQFGGAHHPMHDFEVSHGMMRAVDLKTGSPSRKARPGPPGQFASNHAGVRGLDLMAATTGPHMHKVIRENLEAFTTVIDASEFGRIKAAQQRISQIAEVITDPIVQRISALRDVGPFIDDDDDDAAEAELAQPSYDHAPVVG
ncbi:hypothetical protein [Mycolicibacterium sp.]|uniref:hypothetical protein n=1 Tax=Mycolicibacterium sp. TaxID=2320850 RepID=UPI00355F2328